MITKGLVHVYTGDGKGKTTSAVGLAVRALGHNLKVVYAYFHKNPEKHGYTEINNLQKLGAEIHGFAKTHPFCDKEENQNYSMEIQEGLILLKNIMIDDKPDIMILDEILISTRDGFLKEEILIEFIKSKPANLELVLTGRNAPEKIMALADYVSFVKKIKHPYDHHVTSRKGIEF